MVGTRIFFLFTDRGGETLFTRFLGSFDRTVGREDRVDTWVDRRPDLRGIVQMIEALNCYITV